MAALFCKTYSLGVSVCNLHGIIIKTSNLLLAVEENIIYKLPLSSSTDPVVKVSLASSTLEKSIAYWNGLLSLKIFEKSPKSVILGFGADQAKLELVDIGKQVTHIVIISFNNTIMFLFNHFNSP